MNNKYSRQSEKLRATQPFFRSSWFNCCHRDYQSHRRSLSGYIIVLLLFAFFFVANGQMLFAQTLQWPVDNHIVTRSYTDPSSKNTTHLHTGLDIVSATGSTTVRAAAAGVARLFPQNPLYDPNNTRLGNVIIVDHNNGNGPFTLYGHLDSFSIADGSTVVKGQPIGVMGQTGAADAVHLHFEVKQWGVICNLDNLTGPGWGYTVNSGLPNLFGYINPYPYLTYSLTALTPIVVVSSGYQIVRIGPDTSFTTTETKVNAGQKFAAFATYNGWYQIYLPSINGPATGWIQGIANSSATLVQVNDPTRGVTGINVRVPSPSSSQTPSRVWDKQWFLSFDTAPAGNGSTKPWYDIFLSSNTGFTDGWVSGDYLIPSGVQVDTTPPTITAFPDIVPSSASLGQNFTIGYTAADTGGSGLNRVELWRTSDVNGSPNAGGWSQIGPSQNINGSGNGPISNTFVDTPSIAGGYWYGVHVFDNATKWNDEHNSQTGGVPVVSGPKKATVTVLGTATRIISLSGDIDFGNTSVGSASQRTLTISNTGTSSLTVNSITYPSGFSGNWVGVIPGGGSQPVAVTFSPASTLCYGGTVTVNSNSLSGVNTAFVSGVGVSALANPTVESVYDFNAASGGFWPLGALVADSSGNLYGTASNGTNGNGTVFKLALSSSGALTTVVPFTGANGAGPTAGLSSGNDGNFYGTTAYGGTYGNGTIFRMTPSGALQTIYNFSADNNGTNPDGENPWGGVIKGIDGNFYGTARNGGTHTYGTVYMITPTGTLTTLVNFDYFTNGSSPLASLALGRDNNFYGTAESTVFKVTPLGVLTILHTFSGASAEAGLVLGSDGSFYGATVGGGASGNGTIFNVTSSGTFTLLHSFSALVGNTNSDGASPKAGMIVGSDGNFYGTTTLGGAFGKGTVFKMTPSGNLTTLVSFNGTNGAGPLSSLAFGNDGNLYGTTHDGGAYGWGTIFRIRFSPAPFSQWQASHFTTSELNNANISGWNADADGDGLSNAMEFFFDLNPRTPTTAGDQTALPKVGTEWAGSIQYLTLTYRRNQQAAGSGVEFEISADLSANSWLAVAPDIVETLTPDPTTGDPRFKAKVNITGRAQTFIHLKFASW